MVVSYWQIFRLIFVVFSFYLLGDVLYRWNGVRYYSTFSEFLPSVALIFILWSIVVIVIALLLWLVISTPKWFSKLTNGKIKAEHITIFIPFFVIIGITTRHIKRLLVGSGSTFQLKLAVFCGVILAAIFVAWLFRNKSKQWVDIVQDKITIWGGIVQDRITIWVWLFGILFILSVPLVIYTMWWEKTDRTASHEIAQSNISEKERPNIILVTFDSLTAQNMSLYGYRRETTPFINEWAKNASVFTMNKAGSTITAPTVASLMSGKRVWSHQVYHTISGKIINANTENLPLLLKKYGYHNIALTQSRYASVEILDISNSFDINPLVSELLEPTSIQGFIEQRSNYFFGNKFLIYNWLGQEDFFASKLLDYFPRKYSVTEHPPEKVFNTFLEKIDNNPSEPFFAWIHILPPHDPYLPPEPYMSMFNTSKELKTHNSQFIMLKLTPNIPPEEKPINIIRARYDGFIRYCDKQFEYFIEQLKKKDVMNNTIIILSSDHGESFEHGFLTHGVDKNLYEQVTHIPLIIKKPDQREGQIINDLVEQVDIPATILDLAHIPVPPWMEGRSLAPLLRGNKLKPKPAFSMILYNNKTKQRITKGSIAVWEGDYKLIHFLDDNKSLLFNLTQDPDELNNLLDKETEVSQRLLSLIQENLQKANEKIVKGK